MQKQQQRRQQQQQQQQQEEEEEEQEQEQEPEQLSLPACSHILCSPLLLHPLCVFVSLCLCVFVCLSLSLPHLATRH